MNDEGRGHEAVIKPYLREKLGHRRVVGTHIEMTDSLCSEVIGRVGYDFVLVDAVDSEASYTALRNHMSVLSSEGTPTVVRVAGNMTAHVGRVLELGPDGVIFPGLVTARDVEEAMQLCVYPPEGRRRYSPLRAVGYGLGDAMTDFRRDSTQMCRFVQLDSAEALRNLPEMVENPLIDGFFFAPGELCRADGTPDGVYGADTEELLRQASGVIADAGLPFGVSILREGGDVLRFWLDLGATLIASGADFGYILGGATENLTTLRGL